MDSKADQLSNVIRRRNYYRKDENKHSNPLDPAKKDETNHKSNGKHDVDEDSDEIGKASKESTKIGQVAIVEKATAVETVEDYLLKKRKWPMKGWHKRFFRLDKGFLIYSRTQSQMQKGKISGSISVANCAITTKRNSLRLDFDEESVYHLKAKNDEQFSLWVQHLKGHRDYCFKLASMNLQASTVQTPGRRSIHSITVDQSSTPCNQEMTVVEASNVIDTNTNDRNHAASNNEADIEKLTLELNAAEDGLACLSNLLMEMKSSVLQIDNINRKSETAASKGASLSDTEVVNENEEKKECKPKKNPTDPSSIGKENQQEKDSNTATSSSSTSSKNTKAHQDIQVKEEFTAQASVVHSQLKAIIQLMTDEREKLKTTIKEQPDNIVVAYQLHIKSLQDAVTQTAAHNEDLRNRLREIKSLSEFGAEYPDNHLELIPAVARVSVISESATLFYDAEPESFITENDSSDDEDSEAESAGCETEDSDAANDVEDVPHCGIQRRDTLPVFQGTKNDISVFGLLRKNIGKDLSKISMPVSMNEPLSALQRLCEDLEYSEYLDKASMTDDPSERMAYIAAFAVSAYSNSYYRAGQKPFNPLLGETYETIREDRGFKFIAEQVSHHPPISACHAESERWTFWQDARLKNKFWGKSLEVFPRGCVNVKIHNYDEVYQWKKVTACVHNILRGQRWIEYYGEMVIKNSNNGLVCKLTFSKGGPHSNKRCEVKGHILDANGKILRTLFGKWHECLYIGQPTSAICLWRPGVMPPSYEKYYGFTKFAIELNEIEPDHPDTLPLTDSRYRPDQRYLELGNLKAAEDTKLRLEELQRATRKERQAAGQKWSPRFFELSNEEIWVYNGNYWTLRQQKFSNISHPRLW